MSRPRTMLVCGSLAIVLMLGAGLANAQFVVFDPAVTFKDTAIAALKELLAKKW